MGVGATKKRRLGGGLLVLGMLAVQWLTACQLANAPIEAQLLATATSDQGYARATGPVELVFPADHGPHPDFQTEWWYVTGNLDSLDGRHFGYQLTFFRRALVPPGLRSAVRESEWAADQVYLSHFALTDVSGGSLTASERFERGALGLAGAQAAPLAVWLADWRLEENEPGSYHLRVSDGGRSLDLNLLDRKGPILHGDQGYSQKGPAAGNASYYISQTRLETLGTVELGGSRFEVSGLSWMDHEYSTSALSAGQVGWDWFSLQLDDGSELMVFELRRVDGSSDPFSSGTLIGPDGSTRHLTRDDFSIDVRDTWRSRQSGAVYPAAWRLKVPSADLTLELKPYVSDQELNLSTVYWEGAVQLSGARAGRPVAGSGYVELTGYAGSMQGQF